eukprot:4460060-Prymnesium_polylepis.1
MAQQQQQQSAPPPPQQQLAQQMAPQPAAPAAPQQHQAAPRPSISSGAWQRRRTAKEKGARAARHVRRKVRCFRGRWLNGDPSVPYDPPYGKTVQLLWGACKQDAQGAWPTHHQSWYRYDGKLPWTPI